MNQFNKTCTLVFLGLFSIFSSNLYAQWTQQGADIDGEANDDNSGRSVSISMDGTVVAIGAPNNSGGGTNRGHVRVYKNIGGTWTQQGLDIDGEADQDQSGYSVSLHHRYRSPFGSRHLRSF